MIKKNILIGTILTLQVSVASELSLPRSFNEFRHSPVYSTAATAAVTFGGLSCFGYSPELSASMATFASGIRLLNMGHGKINRHQNRVAVQVADKRNSSHANKRMDDAVVTSVNKSAELPEISEDRYAAMRGIGFFLLGAGSIAATYAVPYSFFSYPALFATKFTIIGLAQMVRSGSSVGQRFSTKEGTYQVATIIGANFLWTVARSSLMKPS